MTRSLRKLSGIHRLFRFLELSLLTLRAVNSLGLALAQMFETAPEVAALFAVHSTLEAD